MSNSSKANKIKIVIATIMVVVAVFVYRAIDAGVVTITYPAIIKWEWSDEPVEYYLEWCERAWFLRDDVHIDVDGYVAPSRVCGGGFHLFTVK